MQFITKNQARFATEMQAMQRAIEAMQEHSRQTGDRIRTLTDALLSLARITEENAKTYEHFRESDAKIARLAELGEGTEARLNAFIPSVEKYIGGRNGGKA
jgi:hypothetical protein